MDLEKLKKDVYAETITTGCTDYGSKMIGFTIDVLAERGLIKGLQIPETVMEALKVYRDEHCFDDSEYGIAIDKFLSTYEEIK